MVISSKHIPTDTKARMSAPQSSSAHPHISTRTSRGELVDACLQQIAEASVWDLIELERKGIAGAIVAALALRMGIPLTRLFEILGMPRSTGLRKVTTQSRIDGAAGQAALGVIKLASTAIRIVGDSTAPEAEDFDVLAWFGRWIEVPQPALAGRKPSELLCTPTGAKLVERVLGAMHSGAYL